MASCRFIASLLQLSGHRWLKAIRNSLVLLLPVTFIGAMAVLFGSLPFALVFPEMAGAFGHEVSQLVMLVGNASSGILAIFLLVLVSHSLALEARRESVEALSPPLVVTIALINFFIYVQLSEPVAGQTAFGTHSILPAIVVAIFSAEVFAACQKYRYRRLKALSYDLDPAIHLAVRSILPALVTVLLFLLIAKVLFLLSFDLSSWVGSQVLSTNDLWGSPLPGLLVVGVLNQALWFVGIHGPHALDTVYRIAFEPQAGQSFEITRTLFHLYVHIGGSGATLGLLLALLIQRCQGEARRIAKLALFPSLFNINEPLIYGLPIVFNPLYLTPFVLVPVVQIIVSYCAVHYGLVALDVMSVPWMTPPLLAGTLNSGGWHGGALQLFNLLLSVVIYWPFVRLAERRRQAESLATIQRVVNDIEVLKRQQRTVLDRHDELGHTARKLLHEFLQEINSDSTRAYLAYQPQHDRSGVVVGVEALIRWEHRDFGFISPAVICALAEESQQIIPIGRWALATACRQLRDWKQHGVANLRLSVNLSPIQLKDESLLTFIEQSLKINQLDPWELCLELTESQYVPEDDLSIGTLKGLQGMGIHLEMDDFGMGYSSMLYVRRFKFSSIKLDGSLTKDVLQDNNCRDIVSSVAQLGRALGIRLIAEYVETRQQQEHLDKLGCDVFQGYLYSPAISGEACLDYLLAHQRPAG